MSAVGSRAFDEALDAFALGVRDEWTHFAGVVEWVGDGDGAHGGDEGFFELFGAVVGDVDACGGGAVLPGVEGCGNGCFVGDGFDVGVVEDDEGCFAAEFEVDAFQGVGGGVHDAFSSGGGAGEADHADVGVFDKCLSCVVAAADDVEDSGGDACFGREFGEHEGGEGGVGCGFEDDGAACGERGSDFPDCHHEGVVPGGDLSDDADGFAAEERGVAGGVFTCACAVGVACGGGEEAQVVDGEGEVAREAEVFVGFAGVLGFGAGECFGVCGDEVSKAPEGE